jgi:DNA-binding CsgD family transcriptional regulator
MLNDVKLPKQPTLDIDLLGDNFNRLPCTVIIHDLKDWSVVYMSENGLLELQTSMADITALSSDEYHKMYFNHEDAQDYVPKILNLLDRNNDDDSVSYFQQVKLPAKGDWSWYLSSTKIFMRDKSGKPAYTITVAVPLDAMHHITAKAERLLQENNFLRNNFKNFAKLTRREKEVLAQVAMGKTAGEIAKELFISTSTAETHRKNIKQKLNANTYELMQYARAFNLI